MVEDFRSRTISHWTTVGALVAGLALFAWRGGWSGLLDSFLGALIGFVAFLAIRVIGGEMGGGDVMLMAGYGALLGKSAVLMAILLSLLAGGVFAAGFLLIRGLIRKVQGKPSGIRGSGEKEYVPYAPAITVGAWLAMVSEL